VPAAREDLQWVNLNDFSAGIVDPLYSKGNPAFGPLGSARDAQGCLPSPTGGLRPGWRLMAERVDTNALNNWTSGYRPTDYPRTWQVASGILSPVESHTVTPFLASASPTVTIAIGATTATFASGATANFVVGDGIQFVDSGGTAQELRTLASKTATTLTWSGPLTLAYAAGVTTVRSVGAASSSEVQMDTPDVVAVMFMDYFAGSNDGKYTPVIQFNVYDMSQSPIWTASDASVANVAVTGTDWRKVGGAIAVGQSGTITSGVSPATVWAAKAEDLRNFISAVCFVDAVSVQFDHTWPTPLAYSTGAFAPNLHLSWRALTYHDNRTVGVPRRPVGSPYVLTTAGSKQAAYQGNMNIEFTGQYIGVAPRYSMYANYPTTPLLSVTDGSGFQVLDAQANPATALVSINGQALLIVCNNVGGYMVRGSIEKPQLVKLAGMPPSRGRVSVPVVTPAGVVYGTRDGVFAVGEDGSSQLLSPNLPPEFWVPVDAPPNFNRLDAVGKFNYCHPYLLAPNNYLMIAEAGSWWKLSSDPTKAPYSMYEVSSVGQVYAFPQYRTQTETTVFRRFDPNLRMVGNSLNSSYTWRSNGIKELTPDARAINVRAIEITGSGFGTVTVQINASGTIVGSKTFTFNSATPATIRSYINTSNKIPVGLTATTIDILVFGDGSANPVPNVDEVKVGINRGASSVST
jgi:hypothetical protein